MRPDKISLLVPVLLILAAIAGIFLAICLKSGIGVVTAANCVADSGGCKINDIKCIGQTGCDEYCGPDIKGWANKWIAYPCNAKNPDTYCQNHNLCGLSAPAPAVAPTNAPGADNCLKCDTGAMCLSRSGFYRTCANGCYSAEKQCTVAICQAADSNTNPLQPCPDAKLGDFKCASAGSISATSEKDGATYLDICDKSFTAIKAQCTLTARQKEAAACYDFEHNLNEPDYYSNGSNGLSVLAAGDNSDHQNPKTVYIVNDSTGAHDCAAVLQEQSDAGNFNADSKDSNGNLIAGSWAYYENKIKGDIGGSWDTVRLACCLTDDHCKAKGCDENIVYDIVHGCGLDTGPNNPFSKANQLGINGTCDICAKDTFGCGSGISSGGYYKTCLRSKDDPGVYCWSANAKCNSKTSDDQDAAQNYCADLKCDGTTGPQTWTKDSVAATLAAKKPEPIPTGTAKTADKAKTVVCDSNAAACGNVCYNADNLQKCDNGTVTCPGTQDYGDTYNAAGSNYPAYICNASHDGILQLAAVATANGKNGYCAYVPFKAGEAVKGWDCVGGNLVSKGEKLVIQSATPEADAQKLTVQQGQTTDASNRVVSVYKPFSNTIVKIADSWESGTLVDRATGQEVDPNNPPLDPNIKPWDGKGPAPAPSENPYEVNLESAGNNFVKIVGDPQGLKMLDNALDDLNKNSQSSESIGDSQYKLNDSGDTDLPYGTSTNVCLNYSQRAAALLVSKGIDAYTVIYNGVDSSGEVSHVGVAIKVGVVKYPNSKSGDDYVPTFAVIEPQQDKNGQADYVMGQLGADGTQVTNAYNNADWGFMRIDNAIVIDKYNIPVGAGNWPIATDKSEIYTYTLNPVGIGSNKYITDLSAKQDLSVEVDKNN